MNDHPSLDDLSGHLDEPVTAVATHAEACGSCARRLERLDRARALLAVPLVPDRDEAEAAIARAVAAGPAPGVSGARPARAHPGWAEPGRIGPRRRWLVGVGAAAAVVTAAIVAVGSLRGDSAPEHPTALAGGGGTSAEAGLAAEGTTSLATLGPTSGFEEVVAGVAALLDERSRAAAADGSGGPTSPAPAPGPALPGIEPRPCEDQARAAPGLGPLGTLAVAATTTYRGQPAVVLAFTPPGRGEAPAASLTVLVLARDGCAELGRSAGP